MDYKDKLMPEHIAIIVDGNRRWAKKRGLDTKLGHKKGFERLEEIIKYATSLDIKYISLFVFSTENFNRDKAEVDYLMKIFSNNFRKLAIRMNEENIKVIFSGSKNLLSDKVKHSMRFMENLTVDNTQAVVNFCLNYGGREEIVSVCKLISKEVRNGMINIDSIDEDLIECYLYNELPPIDLMIRTSGEQRISNFMLWQLAYSELYFTETLFPDFKKEDFDAAIVEYGRRDRRFGVNGGVNK